MLIRDAVKVIVTRVVVLSMAVCVCVAMGCMRVFIVRRGVAAPMVMTGVTTMLVVHVRH
ncbi:hypothetical protein [Paraburkholderia humisilvae]|uniref:hypothetical protein n=1 Tax=Paraburkholderia humisilvae TaxID=627669 RepID=UPI001FE90DB5|nr:hypothetical protein [Paraburkholderia humisilvae]